MALCFFRSCTNTCALTLGKAMLDFQMWPRQCTECTESWLSQGQLSLVVSQPWLHPYYCKAKRSDGCWSSDSSQEHKYLFRELYGKVMVLGNGKKALVQSVWYGRPRMPRNWVFTTSSCSIWHTGALRSDHGIADVGKIKLLLRQTDWQTCHDESTHIWNIMAVFLETLTRVSYFLEFMG